MRAAPSPRLARALLAAGMSVLAGWPPVAGADARAGDAARGALAYEARCGGCHSLTADRVGPRHAGVFGRRAGSVPGFDYSPALKRSPLVWNVDTLEQWLADPELLIPGQRMGYSLADAAVRADVVAYLATLTMPLPAPP